MISLISLSNAQNNIAKYVQQRRLLMGLTQQGLAERSGVPLATLRKFEQKSIISLESLLKLLMVVGGIEETMSALKPANSKFTSIDDVLDTRNRVIPKRGRKK